MNCTCKRPPLDGKSHEVNCDMTPEEFRPKPVDQSALLEQIRELRELLDES